MRNTNHYYYYYPLFLFIIFLLGHLTPLSFATSNYISTSNVTSTNSSSSYNSSNSTFSNSTSISSVNGDSDSDSGSTDDRDVMEALKKQIYKAAGNNNLQNWDSADYCRWEGIVCDKLRVKSIDLSARDLTGYLPSDALNSLTYLETLFLQKNGFYGSFPRLENLAFLKEINLSYNSFTDVYDGTFANLTSLRNFSVSQNPNLSPWDFPRDLADSKSLLVLSIDNANINGPIPDFLSSFRSLQFLNLSHNHFTGTVPNTLTSLPSLVDIDISDNSLTGVLPEFRPEVNVLFAGNDFEIGKPSEEKRRSNNVGGILVKVALPALAGLLIIVSLTITIYCVKRWRCKRKGSQVDIESVDKPSLACGSPVKFSYQDLANATDDFDVQRNNLGEGGSCNVFRGVLSNGDVVAVKQLKGSRLISAKAFEAEVNSLGNTRHCNVVRMVGYCVEEKHRLIVYEYMDNGSLDKWIFGANRERSLAWDEKYKIIKQIGEGLKYLQHHLWNKNRILHRDIKPHNVLLDKDMDAKLSDFGLAKVLSDDKTNTVSQGGGTFGYMAPEVTRPGKKCEKSDVYSYGVVVLEIVFENRIWSLIDRQGESLHLIDLVKTKVEARRLHDLIDAMGETVLGITPEIEKTVKLGLWCLNNKQADRPSMVEVVKVLAGDAIVPEDKIDYTSALSFMDTTQYLSGLSADVEEEHSGRRQHSDAVLPEPN